MPWHPSFALFISDVPVRKTVRRSSPRANDKVPSRKRPGVMIHCESTNETTFALQAEFDPTVLAYYAQPMRIELRILGKATSYTPDFAVVFRDHVEIHEVKSDKYANDEDVVARCQAAQEVIVAAGGKFSLTTRAMLHVEPKLKNVLRALRRLHEHIDPGIRSVLLDRARSVPGATVSEIAAAAAPYPATPENVITLVARGDLRVDLTKTVDRTAAVWAPEHFSGPHRVLPFSYG